MIVSLYEELDRLEDGLLSSASITAAANAAAGGAPHQTGLRRSYSPPRQVTRRMRSRQPIGVGGRQVERKGSVSVDRFPRCAHRCLFDGCCYSCNGGGH